MSADSSISFKLSGAKISDFQTTFDASPIQTADGEVIWAAIRIDYVMWGALAPQVIIRVPVHWNPHETIQHRQSVALRHARELIDHACSASGVGQQADITPSDGNVN